MEKVKYFTHSIKIEYQITAIIVAIVNVLFLFNKALATTIVCIEAIVLLYNLTIKKDLVKYYCLLTIFLSLSIEFPEFVGMKEFYSLKNLSIMGINLAIWFLAPLFFIAIKNYKSLNDIKKYVVLNKIFKYLMFLTLIAFIMGLVNILINDNGIQKFPNLVINFLNTCYLSSVPVLLMFLPAVYILLTKKDALTNFKFCLEAILIGVVFMGITSLAFNIYGTYDGLKTLVLPTIATFTPLLLIIILYKNYNGISITFVGGLGLILALFYNSNGKMIIMVFCIPLIFVMFFWKKQNKMVSIFIILGIIIISLIIFLNAQVFFENNILFSSKLDQTLKMLNIFSPEWYANMPGSPKFRVNEFINICLEYSHKPLQIIFGKGYMGTIIDRIGGFGSGISYMSTGFSFDEWNAQLFYNLHETLNLLFLKNGIFGLIVWVYSLRIMIKYIDITPWIIIGSMYFLLFYGYSITISIFGTMALATGLYEVDISLNCAYKNKLSSQ